jgi:hypothetical protein
MRILNDSECSIVAGGYSDGRPGRLFPPGVIQFGDNGRSDLQDSGWDNLPETYSDDTNWIIWAQSNWDNIFKFNNG